MSKKTKKSFFDNVIEFVKLQIAGNILFWGTYLGNALFHEIFGWPSVYAMTVSSILAHVGFFLADKNWVFSDETGKRKTGDEVVRFIAFMGLNFFINLGIVLGLEAYFGISPYIGQFIAGIFFTFWTWAGLKFWVFRHARHARHHAITIETRNTNAKRHAKYQRLAAKQKAKRTA